MSTQQIMVLLGVCTLVLTVAAPMLAFWGSNKYFKGRLDQWQKGIENWQRHMDGQILELRQAFERSNVAVLASRLETAEREIESLREWKHVRVDPYVGAMDGLKAQVDGLATLVSHLRTRGRGSQSGAAG